MIKSIKIKPLLVALVALLVIGGIFYFRSRNRVLGDQLQLTPGKDEVVRPQMKNLEEKLTLSGNIDAASKADVRFQTSGRLSWVGVKEGDRVKKWQSLASLDRQELRKSLDKDFNDYRTSLSQFQDTQDKYKSEKDNVTLTDEMKRILDRSQYSLNNSVIDYELSDLAIKYATIWSPIDGIVVAADQLNPGVNITPATATFTIIDPQSVFLKAEVDQEDVPKLHEGLPATVTLDSYPNDSFQSQISRISFTPISGRSSTVYEIRLALPADNQGLKYRLGMDGNADISLAKAENVLSVPVDAINREDNTDFVYLKDPASNKLTKKPVKIGIETDDDVQILEGLSINDQVVIKK